ncbi:MAG: DHH family phosphoesterase [Clostridia bacterium]|nr:DHH family phosphoesterase [Clostridia bacterium]
MRKRELKIATKLDVGVMIVLFCLMLALFMLLRFLLPAGNELYAAMLTVLVYLSLLSLWVYWRRRTEGAADPRIVDSIFDTELGDMLEAMHHAVILTDETGRVLFANPAFLEIAGRDSVPAGTPFSHLCVLHKEEAGETYADFGPRRCLLRRIPMTVGEHRYMLLNLYDETARLSAERAYAEERSVVAYAIIDNLEEILQFVQNEYAETSARVEERLREWIEGIGGLFRAYDRNKYLMVFDDVHLEECLRNRFDILDEIRAIRVGDAMPITISLGVSRLVGKSLAEREHAAQYALDLALQRGGDQVVLRDDYGVSFFGGRTKTGYKRVNIKARVVARQLLSLIGRADNVLIMGHRYGDYDSFAATVGLARMVLNQGVRVNIVVNRDDENLAPCFQRIAHLNEYKGMFVDGAEALDLADAGTLLIVTDVNNSGYVECPALMEKAQTVAVIDHHIKTASYNSSVKLEYIEPSASSASELVSEIIEQNTGARILRQEEAELLLSGVLLDTKRFTRNTGTRTFAVAQFLRGAGANPGETFEFFKTTAEDLEKEAHFNSNVVIYRKHVAIAACDSEEADASYRIAAAKAADGLLGVKGVNTSFAIVKIEDTVYISARSDGTVNVQVILEKFHGGGHFDVAGAQVPGATVETVIEGLRDSIDEYFDNEYKGEMI